MTTVITVHQQPQIEKRSPRVHLIIRKVSLDATKLRENCKNITNQRKKQIASSQEIIAAWVRKRESWKNIYIKWLDAYLGCTHEWETYRAAWIIYAMRTKKTIDFRISCCWICANTHFLFYFFSQPSLPFAVVCH